MTSQDDTTRREYKAQIPGATRRVASTEGRPCISILDPVVHEMILQI